MALILIADLENPLNILTNSKTINPSNDINKNLLEKSFLKMNKYHYSQ